MSGQFSLHKKRTNKTNAIAFAQKTLFFSKTRWFQPGLRSRKESEVFGWSRISKNTRSWSRIYYPIRQFNL